MGLGSNCVDRERKFREILTRLCGTNFCINCTSWPILHRVSCSRKTVPNAPKGNETHQNISLGTNGVDRERSLREIATRHCARTFALIAPVWRVLHQVLCSSETVSKCTRTERNAPKHEFRDQWCGSGAFVAKKSRTTSCMNICINCTSLALLHQVSCRKKRTRT